MYQPRPVRNLILTMFPVYCLRLSYNCVSWLEGFTMLYLINHPQIKGEQNVAVYKLLSVFLFFSSFFYFFWGGYGGWGWFTQHKDILYNIFMATFLPWQKIYFDRTPPPFKTRNICHNYLQHWLFHIAIAFKKILIKSTLHI